MFAQNAFVSDGLTKEQTDNEYSILYYYFLKDAFGLRYSNNTPFKNKINFSFYLDDLPCSEEQKKALKNSLFRYNYELKQDNVEIKEIVEIDSKKHVIQQCMDIILGSMNFKLNDFDKIKDEQTGKRSKRTIAKEKLYKVINRNIRDIRKGFNVGVRGASWKFKLISAIDMSIAQSTNKVIKSMNKLGYGVNWIDNRKYITYTTPEGYKLKNRENIKKRHLSGVFVNLYYFSASSHSLIRLGVIATNAGCGKVLAI